MFCPFYWLCELVHMNYNVASDTLKTKGFGSNNLKIISLSRLAIFSTELQSLHPHLLPIKFNPIINHYEYIGLNVKVFIIIQMRDKDQILLENIYLECINNPVGDTEIMREISRFENFLDKYEKYLSYD